MTAVKRKTKRIVQGPVVLLIWDGFGLSNKVPGNATERARMPLWHKLWQSFPHTTLRADGEAVGLTNGETGNSEAGHGTIGAGRALRSDKLIINRSIRDKSFQENPAFLRAAAHVIRTSGTLHLMGLLTNRQSGHATFEHILALVGFAESMKLPRVVLHLFTDGRDTSPFHALHLLGELERKLPANVKIGSVSGRFYAMDRDRNWERTALVYNALTSGEGLVADSAMQAIEQAYARGESDEFIIPTLVSPDHKTFNTVRDHDAVIFWNLRSDRARQLAKPFIQHDFEKDEKKAFRRRRKLQDLCFVTMTEFGKRIDGAIPAYPHHEASGTLVEALMKHRQIYIAESEKYAQVTYFMNGGSDAPRFGEERVRIPSIKTASYDRVPQMRAPAIAKDVVSAVRHGYDFVCANFANADMVGHTGHFAATVAACEALDDALASIWKAVQSAHGALLITADHGNAEGVSNARTAENTHHNANPVPFLFVVPEMKQARLAHGSLANVAPTALALLGVSLPAEMTGKKLFS